MSDAPVKKGRGRPAKVSEDPEVSFNPARKFSGNFKTIGIFFLMCFMKVLVSVIPTRICFCVN